MIALSLYPLATTRISVDGNRFFWYVSLAITGSQEFNAEMCLLFTTYMIHKSRNPMQSSLGSLDDSMEAIGKDQGYRLWALGLQNLMPLQPLLLNTPFTYNYANVPQETNTGLHQNEDIYK